MAETGTSNDQEIDMPDTQQALQVGKKILDLLYKMLKGIMTLIKATGKVSRVVATGVWNTIRWLWRNKFGVAIVAGLGIQYKWVITGLDWVSDKLPDAMKGWMGLEDGESLGAMFGNWSEGTFKAGWDKVIELLKSYEGTNWADTSIDVMGEMIAKAMELVGMATPVIVEMGVNALQLMQSIGMSVVGGILSWLFIIGTALNMGDWIYKKASPMLDYIKGWYAKAKIKDQVVKSVEDEIAELWAKLNNDDESMIGKMPPSNDDLRNKMKGKKESRREKRSRELQEKTALAAKEYDKMVENNRNIFPLENEQQSESERPKFGISSLISRMSRSESSDKGSESRKEPDFHSTDDVENQRDKIEVPAFLRRQAN